MRFSRVLLVNPPYRVDWRGLTPPIGLGYLAETLQKEGIEYDILDMNLGYNLKRLHKKLDQFQPDLVGMGMVTRDYRSYYDLLGKIKQYNSQIKIVVGGPHMTIFKEQVLRECPAIDYGITHEGEDPLVELCRNEGSTDTIKGLIYRDNGNITYTGAREFNMDLDRYPWPRYGKFEMSKYVPEITIYSSRGCPHHCIFCPNRLLSPVFRPRSAKNVGDEMEYWYRKGYRQFNFDDDNFNLIADRVYEICDEIERRDLHGLFLRCSNGIRADRVDRNMLIRMHEVGFHYIAFGADAGNNRMLEIVKKGETIEDIENGVKNACEIGYDVKLLFVVGTPYEAWEDVEDKVRLSQKYPIQEVHFYNIIPYPGTELFEWIKENNYFLREPEEYLNDVSFWENVPVFETPELPKDERVRLFKYLSKVRTDIHRKAVRRILRKYKVVGQLASPLIANRVVEGFFYQNRLWRKIIEYVRYKMSPGSRVFSST
jgi:anaerobic magnesium-protoporphyrin IX monomethyl ester cyclase